jgi:transcriptional regulator with XRE-family HTH domain
VVVSETTSIRGRRLAKGLTLRDLAAQCAADGAPVHFTQLGRIERGLNSPRPQLRSVLAKVLDLDVEDFDRAEAS